MVVALYLLGYAAVIVTGSYVLARWFDEEV